jgi:DNA-directed RNA polymerase subunit RPC12/RpoP
MKTNYTEKLICATCGSDSNFEFNEDKSYIKCTSCNREYLGGYDELLELNHETINKVKQQIAQEAKNEILNHLKDTFKDNKNIKIK